jgi:hypothetical protein
MKNFKGLFVVGGVIGAIAALALTGCESTRWGHRNDGRTAGQGVDDNRIASEVKKSLAQEPVFKFQDVDVKAYDGVVQLNAFAESDLQRQRAAEIARQIPGVVRVVNSITLKPEQQMVPTGRTNQAPIETSQENAPPAPPPPGYPPR